ncbi:MAG: TonB-dependent receptor, partial [Kordiimonas sp.]
FDSGSADQVTAGCASKSDMVLSSSATDGIYPAAFFDQYAPQTAMDMIDRLPGFTFDGGSTKQRGFGGGAGNVLVNGVRPTSKTSRLRTLIERIPASQVERVEIIQGSGSSGEAAGQAIIANIVLGDVSSSGKWDVSLRKAHDGRVRPNGNFTYLNRLSGWDTEFNAKFQGEPRDQIGELEYLDAAGAVTSRQYEEAPSQLLAMNVSAKASRKIGAGRLVLNASHERGRWDGQTSRLRYSSVDDVAANDRWYLDGLNRWTKGELGFDWSQSIAGNWNWRLIGLGSYVNRNNGYELTDTDYLAVTESFEDYRHIKNLSEFIGRTTFARTGGKLLPEFGVEVAKNRLFNDIDKVVDGADISLASGDVTIEELRGEAFVNATYQANSALTLTAGVTAEASKVTVSGDASAGQNFKFLKPRLSATYSFSNTVQLTLEAERKVGQLDLSDFAASSEEEDGIVTAGNPSLRPDKTTRVSGILLWNFSDRGSFKVEPFYEWRDDVLEQIVLPSGGEGLGNGGKATFWGVDTNLNLPLTNFIPGGLLMAKTHLEASSFADPVLGGATRSLSSFKPGGRTRAPHAWGIEFRQDLPEAKVSWGAELTSGFTDTVYFVSEVQKIKRSPEFSAFVETSRFLGVKMRLELLRLNARTEDRVRTFYEGNRGGAISGFEMSERKKRAEVRFKVTASF